MKQYLARHKGFTLIEALVLLAIFSLTATAFYQTYNLAVNNIIESKRRLSAVALANERMEHIRNLDYDDIGILGGSPAGLIDKDEIVRVDDIDFRILVDLRYVDDSADGTVATTDTLPDDYKRVQIFVLWGPGANAGVSEAAAKGSAYDGQRVDLTSQFVPPGGLESATGNGIISINVLESDGSFVGGASVRIYHASSPAIDYVGVTDASGNLTYSTPPAIDYEITVSKAGYETIKSEPLYNGTTQLYDPTNPHEAVIVGELTTSTVVSDPVVDFDLHVRDPFCQALSPGIEVDFDIVGGRVKGTDHGDGSSIYVADTTLTTDTSGDVTVYTDTDADGTIETGGDDSASSGEYTVTLNEPGYTLWKMNPGDDVRQNVTDASATSFDCDIIVLDNAEPSLLIKVVDASTSDTPLIDAVVRLQNTTLGYDVTLQTDKYGYVFFPENATDVFINGTYDVRVSADGYNDDNSTLTVSGLSTPTISMNPS